MICEGLRTPRSGTCFSPSSELSRRGPNDRDAVVRPQHRAGHGAALTWANMKDFSKSDLLLQK